MTWRNFMAQVDSLIPQVPQLVPATSRAVSPNEFMQMGEYGGTPPVSFGNSASTPLEASNWWDGAIGTKTAPGWGGLALGAGQGLLGGYLGLQQLGIAKDTLKENKRQFQMNFDAQRQTTNSALEDRQRARVASNPGAYESVGAYMDQNRIR